MHQIRVGDFHEKTYVYSTDGTPTRTLVSFSYSYHIIYIHIHIPDTKYEVPFVMYGLHCTGVQEIRVLCWVWL